MYCHMFPVPYTCVPVLHVWVCVCVCVWVLPTADTEMKVKLSHVMMK